jgi:DNA processing protein
MLATDSFLLLLSHVSGIGGVTLRRAAELLQEMPTPYSFNEQLEFLSVLKLKAPQFKKEVSSVLLEQALEKSDKVAESSSRHGVVTISINDPDYPSLLKLLRDAPFFLDVRGHTRFLNNRNIAVVGTREITSHGKLLGKRLTERLIKEGLTIVSGLAIGCDTVAHQAAVDANSPTIAVLAGGLDKIYPKENVKLAEQIERNGCLVSEYRCGVAPMAQMFVQRDRLQSGMSLGVVVIETGVKGGTMHTVGFAQQQGRHLACLYTHQLSDFAAQWAEAEKFQGNVKLVQEGKAVPLTDLTSIHQFVEKLDQVPAQGSSSAGQGRSDSQLSLL